MFGHCSLDMRKYVYIAMYFYVCVRMFYALFLKAIRNGMREPTSYTARKGLSDDSYIDSYREGEKKPFLFPS